MKLLLIILLIIIHYCSYAQHWSKLGSGIAYPEQIRSIAAVNGKLYVGKQYAPAGCLAIAIWDGSSWDSTGSTCNSTPVWSLADYNNALIVSSCPGEIETLDSNGWHQLVISNYCPQSLLNIDSDLYAIGNFDTIGGILASQIAKWDGILWSAIDTIKWTGFVSAAAIYNNELYIGGNFDNYDGSIQYIAMFDGSIWHNVGNLNFHGWGGINKMIVYKGELYIGGLISSPLGSTSGSGIYRWNGSRWDDVQGGTGIFSNSQVTDMKVFNGYLYVCGAFTQMGGLSANSIAKWDGTHWCSLGTDFEPVGTVACMEIFNNELYVAGAFQTVDADTVNYIVKWIGGNYVGSCSAVGINEMQGSSYSFSLFPNPAIKKVVVNFYQPFNATGSLFLNNTLGQTISTFPISKGESRKEIDVSELAAGVYFVTLQTEEGRVTKRFVKE